MDWDKFTRIDLEALAAPAVLERGLDYYQNGHLISAARLGTVLAGIVAGSGGDYQVRLWFENDTVYHQCSCPYPVVCKHAVALACGWLENKAGFIDLRPLLDTALQDTAALPALFTRLVHENPFAFVKLAYNQTANSGIQNRPSVSRALLNLLRNLFRDAPFFRLNQLDTLRDKLVRAETLLKNELAAGNREALPVFTELLQGIYGIYKESKLPELADYWRSLLSEFTKLPDYFAGADIGGIYSLVLQFYFDPELWEFKEELKEALLVCHRIAPDFLPQYLKTAATAENIDCAPESGGGAAILYLISLYELLTAESMAPDWAGLNTELETVRQRLMSTAEGRLWLIDRLMETDLLESRRLVKAALISGMEPKRSFRDRLIMIHCRQNEFRQAAALSFIQFKEEPNFEEYRRLKDILKSHPADWQSYLKRLQAFLDNGADGTLRLQIAIDLKDCGEVAARIAQAAQTPALLLAAADLLLDNGTPELFAVYPQAIRLLLAEQLPACRNMALRMIIAYKKACLQTGRQGEWERLRTQLIAAYPDDRRFKLKFGGILGFTG